MRYEYATDKTEHGHELASVCNRYARKGWQVHTVIRSDEHGVYRILFVRDVEDPVTPLMFEETEP